MENTIENKAENRTGSITKKLVEVLSAIIMLLGLFVAYAITQSAEGVPQYLQATVPMIGAYILGRAIENIVK